MNVFTPRPQPLKPPATFGSGWTPLIVFLVCLAIGAGLVIWRAGGQRAQARGIAQAEAVAQAARLESQLNRPVAAAETLAVLARQSGGSIPGFQKIASELMAANPGLASLELQPSGVVTEIFPRPADKRVMGLNVLKHATYSAGPAAAVQHRTLVVSGPVPLYSGALGVVATAPVFRNGKDGRETFAGFAAASMRLADVAAAAGLKELSNRGYRALLFAPAQPGRGAVRIAGEAERAYDDPVVQPVRARNMELSLAIQPRGSWISSKAVVMDSLAALAISALAGLLVLFVGRTQGLQNDLLDINQRIARDNGTRDEGDQELRRAREAGSALQAELAEAKAAVQRAEADQARLAKLEAELARANESTLASEARAKQIEQSALEMQARLETALRTAEKVSQTRQAEIVQTREALTRVQTLNEELQTELQAASHAEEKTAASAKERFNRDLAKIDELQSRIDALKKTAAEAEEAGAARILELENENRDLKERLTAMERAETRAAEPTQTVTATAETTSEEAVAPETGTIADSAALETTPAPEPAVPVEITPTGEPDGENRIEDQPADTVAVQSAESASEPAAPSEPAELPDPEPAPVSEPRAKTASVKPVRRRKAPRDNQMDLFGEPAVDSPAGEEESSSRAEVVTAEVELAQSAEEQSDQATTPATEKPAEEHRPRRLPAAPPLDLPEFRQAVNIMVPLLADADPGAKDCLKDNRSTFRSGFHPEAFVEFEEAVKSRDFGTALEQLKKAAKRHGVSV